MQNQLWKTITACRVCGSEEINLVFSGGDQYVVNFIDSPDQKQFKAPLDLVLCSKEEGGCGLLQLKHTFPQSIMYTTYWYRSGVNQSMTDTLVGITKAAKSMVQLEPGDFVIDIGSNDSTLLKNYNVPGVKLIGFEPARNIAERYGIKEADKIIIDYFSYPAWEKVFGDKKAKVITAIAMFYDLDNPNQFMADIVKCLDKEGIFIVQQNYLPYMLEKNVVDNIAHEHLEYYSLTTLKNLMDRHNLEIFDVELNDVNGGSMCTYIKHKESGSTIRIKNGAPERVKTVLENEERQNLNEKKTYDEFAKRVFDIRDKTVSFIKKEIADGKKVYIYGASTRGNALLQYFGLDYRLLTAAADRNPDKWGKKMVGTLIPIISEEQARAEKPDYFFILPFQFLEEFKKREIDFLKRGGKFIVALPHFRIIDITSVSV